MYCFFLSSDVNFFISIVRRKKERLLRHGHSCVRYSLHQFTVSLHMKNLSFKTDNRDCLLLPYVGNYVVKYATSRSNLSLLRTTVIPASTCVYCSTHFFLFWGILLYVCMPFAVIHP